MKYIIPIIPLYRGLSEKRASYFDFQSAARAIKKLFRTCVFNLYTLSKTESSLCTFLNFF